MAFPTSSKIMNNILYPEEKVAKSDLSRFQDKPFVEYLLDIVRKDLQEKGDQPWLTNGAIQATGSSLVFEEETVMINEVEPKSRQIAKVLSHVYNVGRRDVVHILLRNSSQ